MSDGLRTWGLRLLALGIALGLWFDVSFEDREVQSERLIEASVSYTRPKGFVVLDQVQSVSVRVRGSARQIRQLNPDLVDVQVDLTGVPPGLSTVPLGPEHLLMPDGVEVVSIEPNSIRVELEREVSVRLPVKPEIVGKASPGSRVEEAEVYPNQVLVTGPESLVAATEVLRTRPVSLAGHNATFEESVAVVSPDPLIQIVHPSRVSVRVPIQPGNDAQPRNGALPAPTEGP